MRAARCPLLPVCCACYMVSTVTGLLCVLPAEPCVYRDVLLSQIGRLKAMVQRSQGEFASIVSAVNDMTIS